MREVYCISSVTSPDYEGPGAASGGDVGRHGGTGWVSEDDPGDERCRGGGCLGQRDDTAAAATVAQELQERGSIEKKVTRGPREKATL